MKNFYSLIAFLFIAHQLSAQCGTNIINQGDSCSGSCNAYVVFTPSSGTSPYSIIVDGGAPVPFTFSITVGPICAGIHHYILTDAISSCTDSGDVIVTQPSPVNLNISAVSDISCFGGSDGSIIVAAIGGSPPYLYSMDAGITWQSTPIFTNLAPGNYAVTVMDSHACMATTVATISQPGPINTSFFITQPSCGLCDGSVTASVSGGTSPINYDWSPSGSGPTLTNICSGLYILFVSDAHGCIDSAGTVVPSQCDSVWPGDADYSGVVSNTDVLTLGISYGSTGPVRPGATLTWIKQYCADWTDSLASGINYKHSDCDGNGIVNADDTLAISLNYGFLQQRPAPPVAHGAYPAISLDMVTDTTGPNQLLHVKIHVGSATMPVPVLYGIAFSILFDQALVDTTTISLDCSSSGLGTIGVNLLSFKHSNYSSGRIDFAITKTDHLDAINVDSIIGILDLVITDNVSTMDMLRMFVSDVKAIAFDESILTLEATGDSITVDPTFTGIRNIQPEKLINVFPSPVQNILNVVSDMDVEKITLINELGEQVFSRSIHQKNFSINMSGTKNGIYFLELITANGPVRKKICVLK